MSNSVSSPFAVQFLLHPDIAKAADEAVTNIERLRVAGFMRQSFELASALVAKGPWRCPEGGLNYQRIAYRLPLLAWLAGQPCPPVGGHSERSMEELESWVAEDRRAAFSWLLAADRAQIAPAGEQWSEAWLDDLAASLPNSIESGRLAGFITDLFCVLKARVRYALDFRKTDSLVPILAAQPIAISPNAGRFGHDELLRVLERCIDERLAEAGDIVACELLAAVLDIAEENEARAVARLTRTPGHIARLPDIDMPIRTWLPYVDLQRRRAFATALQINDVNVARYRADFSARSPERLDPVAATDRNWPECLAEYSRRRARALADPEAADSESGMAEHHRPLSPALVERAQRLQFTAPGTDEQRIAALEERLGLGLPPSYRQFLGATDGLFGGFVMLLPAEQVDWLRNLEPEMIEGWCDVRHEATDAQYARYGPDQDCIFMRPRHLHTALQISTSIDGDVLLLIPEVRFGEEWEAWFLGAKNPGAYRYRSFAELFDEVLLESADDEY